MATKSQKAIFKIQTFATEVTKLVNGRLKINERRLQKFLTVRISTAFAPQSVIWDDKAIHPQLQGITSPFVLVKTIN